MTPPRLAPAGARLVVRETGSDHRLPGGNTGGMVAVRLREWDRGDAAAIASVLIDPQVLKWSHIAELGVERWIAEQREGRRGPSMAVCDAGDEHVLGKVALRLPGKASPATSCDAIGSGDHPVGELSYWVLPHARGRGVATAAVVAMLDLAREAGEVRAVVLDIEADNVPSIRVAQRVGATRRQPERIECDRRGIPRTMAVFIVKL